MHKFQLTHKQKLFDASRLCSHNLHIHKNRVNCNQCNSSVSIHTKHIFDFIASTFIPGDRYVSLAIGNYHTHPSHQIVLHGGVLFCTKCGSSAVNKIINLKGTCHGTHEDDYLYGSNSLKSIIKVEPLLDTRGDPTTNLASLMMSSYVTLKAN